MIRVLHRRRNPPPEFFAVHADVFRDAHRFWIAYAAVEARRDRSIIIAAIFLRFVSEQLFSLLRRRPEQVVLDGTRRRWFRRRRRNINNSCCCCSSTASKSGCLSGHLSKVLIRNRQVHWLRAIYKSTQDTKVWLYYYIASSYNSCCAGDFQDSYVDLVPLKEVIHQGARVLDFALYLVNDDVVVGAGPTDSDNVKGTYNSIPVSGPDGILSTINSYAFQAPTPNPTDPLFIHFNSVDYLLQIFFVLQRF